jgi:hypothetical protein
MILGDKPLISEVVLSHYRECLSTTRLLLVTYFSRHSHSIVLIHCGVIKVYLKGVFPMQLSFIKFLYVNAHLMQKVKIAKRNPREGYAIGACLAQ